MTTKAIHLEAVTDLTSDAFLSALKRLFARRGKSAHMYSDNGTTFIGAATKLDKEFELAIKQNNEVASILAADKIEWHFIPPASPHCGGIWEAGVKSMKHHLKRTIGESKLTYEEMTTLLHQIEAVLNSRPLCTMNNYVENIEALTPAHFLIGRPMLDDPVPTTDERTSKLDHWNHIQKMKKDFWNRWKHEYLTTLQKRNKWQQQMVVQNNRK
ncbi:uncharacterized protein LOC119665786 [Teleopsis dalmanni]|uniref:uncharacterized protein LOC119665786 n=1 Tax=Teleopsis dalmanni TaxID=139649 RepID=UPI0018CF0D9E|nr:uncharacterized protein LOC119665786 [Teleopsis dalmanni]